MRKRWKSLLAALLCLLLLSGCAGPAERSYQISELLVGLFGPEQGEQAQAQTQNGGEDGEMVPFDRIVYTRPEAQMESLRAKIDELDQVLEGGATLSQVTAILDECFVLFNSYDTMYSVAEIRACQDMTDAFYEEEYGWCLDHYYEMQAMMDELYYLCGGSKLAGQLEREYFWEDFAEEYADSSESSYSDELAELYHRESALLSEYRSLIASPTITVDGQEVDLYSYVDAASGEASFDGWMEYYRSYNERLGRVYIELVKVRTAQARALGFDSFEELSYRFNYERDYTPAQAREYLEGIKTWLVPLYKEMLEEGLIDEAGTRVMLEDELEEVLRTVADNMGGDVQEAFGFLSEYGLYDVRYSERKMGKSFQSYLTDYEAPFVFLDPILQLSDVASFAHEFGHALDAYVNYNAYESMDLAECFSQAMELLAPGYADGALNAREQADLYRYKAMDNLEMYVQQGSFAEFEELVYGVDPEELTVEMINGFSLQTAKDYGYYEPGYEDYYALSWIDITHFFETPFYIISYPVSNDVAMQIYELERETPGSGLDKYLEMLPRNAEGLLETVLAGGLESPFAPGRLEKVAEDLREQLEEDSFAAAA